MFKKLNSKQMTKESTASKPTASAYNSDLIEMLNIPDTIQYYGSGTESTNFGYIPYTRRGHNPITGKSEPQIVIGNKPKPVPSVNLGWDDYPADLINDDNAPNLKKMTGGIDPEGEWIESYKNEFMNKNSKARAKKPAKSLNKSLFTGSLYQVDELLKTFNILREKEIGDIAITGSLALFLQGKIKRTGLGDLDICVRSSSVELDDEFEDVYCDVAYEELADVPSPKSYYFNKVLIDIFPVSKNVPNTLYVDYKGKSYLCVSYMDILDVKLKMILPRMKDYNELYNNVFSLTFK